MEKSVAKHSDYEELMEMSEGIYDGYDFLPFCFHHWVDQPKRKNFIWRETKSGKIIGFLTFLRINDDFVNSSANRISKDFRGKRLISKLFKDCESEIGDSTVLMTKYAGEFKQAIIDKMNVLANRAAIPINICRKYFPNEPCNLQSIPFDGHFEDLLESHESIGKLCFEGDFIIVGWVIYCLNLLHCKKKNIFILAIVSSKRMWLSYKELVPNR